MPPTDRFVSETAIRVRYAETDRMGIVHHSAYIVWFEAGRSDWLRQRGSSYAVIESHGYFLPLSDLSARFIAPAHYDEVVIIKSWVAELKSRKLTFGYEAIHAESGQLLATGYTSHICLNRSGQVTVFPAEVQALLKA